MATERWGALPLGEAPQDRVEDRRRVLLICGDRNWQLRAPMLRELERWQPDLVIHGAAKGADQLAGELAAERGIEQEAYPAAWARYGRAAGPIRNAEMCERLCILRLAGAEVRALAFHEAIERSKGTSSMIDLLADADIPWALVAS